jgi:hypothetical protein
VDDQPLKASPGPVVLRRVVHVTRYETSNQRDALHSGHHGGLVQHCRNPGKRADECPC